MNELRGLKVSNEIKEQVQAMTAEWSGPPPTLAIVRVGDRPDDVSYERGAVKKMEAFGLKAVTCAYPGDISDEEFKERFAAVNADPSIHGILLLRPLPEQIREKDIEEMIDPQKDLDGISPVNLARVFAGDNRGFAPCTAEAVVEVLKSYQVPISGSRVTIVGRSMVVGRPLSMLLLKENATVTICHTRTRDLPGTCRQAEILVAAAGRARMLNREYAAENAVVIDVGIHVDSQGKLCGDVDFDSLEGHAAMATPVPGGVGTVTTAVLARHLVRAAKAQNSASE